MPIAKRLREPPFAYVVGAGLIAGAVPSGIYLLVRAIPLPPSAQVAASKPIDIPSPVVRCEPMPTIIPSTTIPPTLLAPASNKPESETGLIARYILSLFENRTGMQGQNLLKTYLGQPMTVSGIVTPSQESSLMLNSKTTTELLLYN